ncbi:intracellular hyaluronan-binding protein 4-like isoform X2 [Branchiostoma floridae x Branchiostoma japonicum]
MPMDSEYGIAVTNKFQFLTDDEEEDPSEARQKELAQREERAKRNKEEKAKKAAKEPERKPKSAKLPDKKKPLSASVKEKENVPDRPKKEDPPSRPNRAERRRQQQESNSVNADGDERSDRQPRRDRGNRPKRIQDSEEGGRNVFTEYRTERTDSERPPRGRGGFARGGRGRGRGGFFGGRDFRGKREFERHSGSEKSGVRPSEKREGGGAYNWGSQTDAAEDLNMTAGSAEENPEWTAPTEEGENSEPKEGAEGEQAPGEQEPKEMTLDEWKALQAKDTKPKSGFKLRKAGEGEDLTQWKKTYVLKKGQEEEDADKYGQDQRGPGVGGRGERGQKQMPVELNFHFADSPQRGGRGGRRGGRGGGRDDRPRGGRGRGGFRSNGADPAGAYINVDDEADFPQLGK